MKKLASFIIVLFLALAANAQDIIVKKDGTTIQAKVQEVTTSEIKYKKASNPNGPTYSIEKSAVLAINYENGEKDTFSESQATTAPQNGEPKIEAVKPNSENDARIAWYNQRNYTLPANKPKGKTKLWLGTLGVDEKSVLKSDALDIDFISQERGEKTFINNVKLRAWVWDLKKATSTSVVDDRKLFEGHYIVQLTNKTSHTIYVDLASTFRLDQTGAYKVYYDGTVATESNGQSIGAGVNLGAISSVLGVGGSVGTLASGINVGGGKNSGTSVSRSQQRILGIPPYGKVALSKDEYLKDNSPVSFDESFYNFPKCNDVPVNENVKVKKGEVLKFNDLESSPMSYRYVVTFSHTMDFANIQTMTAAVYLKDVIGVGNSALNGYFSDLSKEYFGQLVGENAVIVIGKTKK